MKLQQKQLLKTPKRLLNKEKIEMKYKTIKK